MLPTAVAAESLALRGKRSTLCVLAAGESIAAPASEVGGEGGSGGNTAAHPSADSQVTSELQRLGGRFLAEGSCPCWSPQGSSIVYGHGDELRILDIAPGTSRSLATSGRSAAWSPGDGHYIAYVRGPEGKEEICLYKTSGGHSQRLAAGKNPRWSKDGSTLYFSLPSKPQLYAIDIEHQRPAQAVDKPGEIFDPAGLAAEGGRHLARMSADSLQIVDRKTGKSTPPWPVAKTVEGGPVWSPDGRYLAFAGFRYARGVILGVLDVESNHLLRIGGSQCGWPCWSPNGSELAFVVRRNSQTEIWRIATSALQRSPALAPACACPNVPQAAAELVGPWHCACGRLVAIDLSQHYTAAKCGIKSNAENDNPLDLPAGPRLLAGVEFQIGERMLQLRGQRAPQMPLAVKEIPVHRRVVRLYILHATQDARSSHGVREGELIAEYRVHYADGDVATIPVNVGQDVRDWWTSEPEPLARSQVAWAGENKAASDGHCYLRLFLSTWKNPHLEKVVASIDYVSMQRAAAPFCLAITAEEPRRIGAAPQASSSR